MYGHTSVAAVFCYFNCRQKPLPVLLNDPRPSTTTSSFRVSPPVLVHVGVPREVWPGVNPVYHLVCIVTARFITS